MTIAEMRKLAERLEKLEDNLSKADVLENLLKSTKDTLEVPKNLFFDFLKNVQGEGNYDFETIVPKSWNHYKRQYVAEIIGPDEKYDGLKRGFISKLTNFSRSGANASLEVDEPEHAGTLIEVKEGSHKHMYVTIYRKKKNGKWEGIAQKEVAGGFYGGGLRQGWRLLATGQQIKLVEPFVPTTEIVAAKI